MSYQNIPCRLLIWIAPALFVLLLFIPNRLQAAPLRAPVAVEAPLAGMVQVATGYYHTCALTNSGSVKCWGNNSFGELGNGSLSLRLLPTDVIGLEQDIKMIAAGGYQSCALTNQGITKCWGGYPVSYELPVTTTIPTEVPGLGNGVTAIDVGREHACALTNAGGVKCWGSNYDGGLGNGTYTSTLTAVDVVGLTSGVQAIAAGGNHTCALTNAGGVKCWGSNYDGELGNGGYTSTVTAMDVVGLSSGVKAIAAGDYHTCALTSAGGVKCWGYNAGGQLGDGTTIGRVTPVDVVGLSSGVTALVAGYGHTCALSAEDLKCWGDNGRGQLGDGSNSARTIPVTVLGVGNGVSAIAGGRDHSCAIAGSGQLKCWGSNSEGQLGTGHPINQHTPVDVYGLSSGIHQITAGSDHTCGLTIGGGVKCWGDNFSGQLGDNSLSDRATTVDVVGLVESIMTLDAGDNHTCAVTSAGGVKCWGYNADGELGDGTNTRRSTPINVSGLSSGVKALAPGRFHTCALTSAGGVKCWGYNSDGQLGDGTTTSRLTPVDVTGLTSGVQAISAGSYHTCALTNAGGMKCWGSNVNGQLGDGTNTRRLTSVNVTGLSSGVKAIAAGSYHTCAVTSAGGMKCWGNNYDGELGNGTYTNTVTAVDVVGLSSGVKAIAAGDYHTCAVTSSDGVKCWGSNLDGYLGDGTTTKRSTPVDVVGLSSGVKAIAVGGTHSCALTNAGGMKCWGYNYDGQLGDGKAWQTLPIDVVATCYALTLTNSGNGSAPIALPDRNSNCPTGSYLSASRVNLSATPASGWQVAGWNGTANNASIATTNTLLMPAADHSAGVTYSQLAQECYPLTLLHSGSGNDPVATPAHSDNCTSGFYHAGVTITLNASPAAGWRVASWQGTDNDAATSIDNTLTMPAVQRTVNVAFSNLPETFPSSGADKYEIDDTCAQATLLTADGTSQTHSFHQFGDTDWLRFDAGGANYRVEVHVPTGSPADVELELYPACAEAATNGFAATFTPGVRLDFAAPASGVVYLRLANADPSVAGAQVTYHLSVRRLDTAAASGALILVAGRLKNSDPLQENIHRVTQNVHELYRARGYSADNIHYLATDSKLEGYDLPATVANLQDAILQWAPKHVGEDRLLTLYVMDHGDVDKFFLDGPNGQEFSPQQLDGWLTQLEAAVEGIKITVILEACNSGSFISGLQSVSQPGRIVIASTTETNVAYASATGAYFSDHFLMGLRQGYSLYNSYRIAYASTRELTGLLQEPWLDGNGNSIPNEPEDVTLASRQRTGHADGIIADLWAPYIVSATGPSIIVDRRGIIQAEVRDNQAVRRVWAVIYPPSYHPPVSSLELVPDMQPTIVLQKQNGDMYQGDFPGFDEQGIYRIAIYAEDENGLLAQPKIFTVNTGMPNYIPAIRR